MTAWPIGTGSQTLTYGYRDYEDEPSEYSERMINAYIALWNWTFKHPYLTRKHNIKEKLKQIAKKAN